MKRSTLVSFLDEYLRIGAFDDISTNGLVVGSPADREVSRVAVAVDANLYTFREAVRRGADLLCTHHGLFWGRPIPVTGTHYGRIRTLLDGNLDLYVCHLPLDAHPEVGNNAVMARRLGLEDLHPFAPWRGSDLGWWGTSARPLSRQAIIDALGFTHPVVLPFGKEEIHTVGIVSGAGSDDVEQAMALGLDCFVTGDVAHEQASECEEARMNVIGGGHYRSEVFGVQAVGELLARRFGLDTFFIEHDTGL